MKKIVISAGVCGEVVEAVAEKVDKHHVRLKITKCCEHVGRMKTRLEKKPLNVLDLMSNLCDSEIYKAASQCLPHTTCPVPSALSKLVEAEMGLAVPVDVSIRFEEEGREKR